MLNNTPLISVIVPVYNVGHFLAPCLDSLIAQTYQNLEILLIDDGSTDGSGERCDEYAARDSRIKVTHKQNGGVSSARNLGLDIAQGEYIAFVDADDRVLPDCFEVLFHDIVQHNADIVCCNFAVIDEDGNRLYSFVRDSQGTCPNVKNARLITENASVFLDIQRRQELYFTHAIAKLMRTSLAKQCRYQKLKFSEDTLFMFDLFCLNPTVYLTVYAGYQYMLRKSSVTHSAKKHNLQHPKDALTLAHHQYTYFSQNNTSLCSDFRNMYVAAILHYANVSAQPVNRNEWSACCQQIQEHILQILPFKNQFSRKTQVKLTLFTKAPWLYAFLVRIKGKLRR